MNQLTFGSLFAGIGGMDLGLERAGMKCVWQVDIDDDARRVLAKHWPDMRRWDDVRTFPPGDGTDWRCDLIAGGFPCQDISPAGSLAGIDGSRSGLWAEFARVLSVLRPRLVLLENSSDLPLRGLERILGDIHLLGFDAEWQVVSARTFGAPHLRRRTFVVCYPSRGGWPVSMVFPEAYQARPLPGAGSWWDAEPGVCRVVDRTAVVVDRLRGIGNAVVPQVAEWIGRRILACFGATPTSEVR